LITVGLQADVCIRQVRCVKRRDSGWWCRKRNSGQMAFHHLE